jgi:hypothetical protein
VRTLDVHAQPQRLDFAGQCLQVRGRVIEGAVDPLRLLLLTSCPFARSRRRRQ